VSTSVAYSRRQTSRTEADQGVYVYWSCSGRDDLSRVRDISLGGLFIETPNPRMLGAPTQLHFLVSEGQIRADAIVRHVTPGKGVGLKFTAVNDQDRRILAILMKRLRSDPHSAASGSTARHAVG
jgi:PilZ domain